MGLRKAVWVSISESWFLFNMTKGKSKTCATKVLKIRHRFTINFTSQYWKLQMILIMKTCIQSFDWIQLKKKNRWLIEDKIINSS